MSTQPIDPAALEFALRKIHDTFKADLDSGYRTRDKEFAVDIAAFALKKATADDCHSCKTALGKDGLCGNLTCQDYKKRD